MSTRVPPRTATWLLMHVGAGYHTGSLAGDLREEFQRGRTRAWYWRQVALGVYLARTRFLRGAAVSLLDAVLGAFAVIALGVGTLAWAAVIRQQPAPPHCALHGVLTSAGCADERNGGP